MRSETKHNILAWLLSISLVLGFIAIFYGIGVFMGSYSCNSYGEITGHETKYTISNGCFVKVNGSWVQKDQIRKI